MADLWDEAFDDGIERSILQRRDYDRPTPIGQIGGNHVDRPPVRVEAQNRVWKRGDEMAGSEHAHPQVNRKGHHADLRHPQSTRSEGLCHNTVVPTVRRFRQDPRFVDKFGEIDLATAPRPWAGHSGRHDQAVVEKNLYIQVIDEAIVRQRLYEMSQGEIEASTAQAWIQ